MNWANIGSVIAICVLVLCIILMIISKLPVLIGCLLAALAVARLT